MSIGSSTALPEPITMHGMFVGPSSTPASLSGGEQALLVWSQPPMLAPCDPSEDLMCREAVVQSSPACRFQTWRLHLKDLIWVPPRLMPLNALPNCHAPPRL
jgi:hypothetical protein